MGGVALARTKGGGVTDARQVEAGAYLTNETKLVEVVEVLPDGRVRCEDVASGRARLIIPSSLKYWRLVRPAA